MIPEFSIWDEIDQIKGRIDAIPDPALQVRACGEAFDQLRDLIVFLGSYGRRGEAARDALKLYGPELAASKAGVTLNTINRLAGR